ncbi:spore germination protein [Paenibacillus puerhi]|uniref:spore germination protein n=1 Tax=Paenibacillus puerhi TaxID=2692622 RepID=UPI001357AA28|nr:spore germination protein [Paenibacillus puerhi]
MPAIVGAIKINNVSLSSIVHIGDSLQLAPRSVAKTFAGAGSFNTGDNLRVINYVSTTNTYDNDVLDSNIAFTN